MEIDNCYFDTTPLIEYFRKVNKSQTKFSDMRKRSKNLVISTVTEYEILCGCKTALERAYWRAFLADFVILPFDRKAADCAAEIFRDLKLRNQMIESRDIFIAAIAMTNGYAISTLNVEHFARIKGLAIH